MQIRAAALFALAVLVVSSPSAVAQPYSWEVFAGGAGGPGSIDGFAPTARLRGEELVIAPDGVIYFTTGFGSIQRLNPVTGELTTFAGNPATKGHADGGVSGLMNEPADIDMDAAGNFYTVDRFSSRVRKVSPMGVLSTVAGNGVHGLVNGNASSASFNRPEGIAINRATGVIYIADRFNHQIRKIENGVVSTFAGSTTSGSTNGTGAAARFNEPQSMAIDAAGNLYVCDVGNRLIRRITPAGAVTTIGGDLGSGHRDGYSSRFQNPNGIAVAPSGDVYVTDNHNSTVRKIAPDGYASTVIGLPLDTVTTYVDGPVATARTIEPNGLAVDSSGAVFFVDQGTIRKIAGGTVSTIAGQPLLRGYVDANGTDARLNEPNDVVVDASGNVFTVEGRGGLMRKITPSGDVSTFVGTPGQPGNVDGVGSAAKLATAYGMTIDPLGNIWWVQTGSQTVRKVTPDGTVTTVAGDPTAPRGSMDGTGAAARFYLPNGLCAADDGNVYVTDTYNHTIRKVTPEGVVTTFAGTAGAFGYVNGTGSAARFNFPMGCVYSGGFLYVADTSNLRIRRVSLAGEVTAFAGNGTNSAGDGAPLSASFQSPSDITADAAGNLYVYESGRVRKLTASSGYFVSTLGSGISGGAIGAASNGTVYAAEPGAHRIQRGMTGITAAAAIDSLNGTIAQMRQLSTTGSGATSWEWSVVRRPSGSTATLSDPSLSNPTFTPDRGGNYGFRLVATGAGGKSFSTVYTTIQCGAGTGPVITVTAGATPACPNESITLEAADGFEYYVWSNGTIGRTLTVTPASQTTYTVTGYRGLCGWSTSYTQTMKPHPLGLSITNTGSTNVCPTGTAGTFTVSTTGTADSYRWGYQLTTTGAVTDIPGETATTYLVNGAHFPGAGSYFLVCRASSNDCPNFTRTSNLRTITVYAATAPTITPSGPTTFCDGGSVTLTSSAGASYLWSTGATTQAITVSAAGSYSVTVTDANGCGTASAPVAVTVTPLPDATVVASGPTTFCPGGSVTLTAPDAMSGYLWSNGATTRSITVSEAGTYSVTVTHGGCSRTSTPVVVDVHPAAEATIAAGGPTTFCEGGSVTLTANSGAAYLWSTGATTQSITVSVAGSYGVTVTNENGCAATSSATAVTVNTATASITAGGPTTFCDGGSVTLTANAGAAYLWSNGATTQAITVSASGAYSVAVTSADGCTATSAATSVTVDPNPDATVVANGPTTFCEGGSVTLTAPAGMTAYAWSNGAATQSITVSASGSYSVTVTNANGCSATSAATTVTVDPLPAPAITADGATTFCEGGNVTLTASAGSSFAWSNGATTQSITISASGSYSVTVTNANGCSATSAPTTVTVNPLPAPTITAGGATTFCEGGSVTLTASAGSSYAWSNGATTQSITVSASGSYGVTVTNANGCSATSAATSVTVNPLPAPTITAGGPTSFCEGGSVTLTASAGSSYAWSNGATTQSITVSASGSYSVAVTNANGCSATSAATTVTVNPLPAPTITANGATTFCEGGSVTLTASAGSSFAWSNGATTQSITISASGSYSVTVTNANGCSATSAATSVTVNPLPAPTITAGGPTTFCEGGSVTLTASASSSYAWSNGATTQSIAVSASGSYSVNVTNANGCSATSAATSVTVNPLPAPTITAGGATTFCEGGSVTLTASAGSSYAWSNGAATQSITVSASGSYSVTVTNANGCSATSAPTTVTVNPLPAPTITAAGPTTFCEGGSVTLTASADSSYAWSNGATTQSITVSASGSYSVTVTNANGCSATSAATSVTVNPLPAPTITAGGPTTFCEGGSVTLTASAGSSYAWSNGATTQAIIVSASGSYSVTVTNANSCSATSAATSVTVNPLPAPTITAGGPTTFCEGGSVTLTASAGSSYAWSNGATTQSITVSASGSYSVTVTNANGCSAASAATTVTVNAKPTPAISADGPTTFCAGEDVILTASSGASYLWSSGATTQSITVTASGSYSVTVTNGAGCSATSSATTVTVNAKPTPAISADGPTTFCAGEDVILTASSGTSWLWSNGATTQSITVTASGNYSVTVTNGAGCSATSAATSVTVNAKPTPTISADGPTTFCAGEDVVLTASSGASYLWSTGATTQSITVTASGSYSVTVTNGAGCSATSAATTVTVNAKPTPTITADGPTTFCVGEDVVLTASSGASYLWSNGATTQSITVTASGNYSVTVTNGAGCSATSAATSVTVNAKPTPAISADGPTTFCAGEDVVLTASSGASWLWSNGATTQSIAVTASGNYSVTVTNAAGCSATSAATSVTVNAKPGTPVITADGPTTFCAIEDVVLTAPAGFTYLWSTGATTQSITVTASGNYTVTVTNASGCSTTSAPTAVTVKPRPTVTGPTPATQTVRKNQTPTSITVTAPAGSTYQWYQGPTSGTGTLLTGQTTASFTPSTINRGTFYYWVRVTNNGCSTDSAVATVIVN